MKKRIINIKTEGLGIRLKRYEHTLVYRLFTHKVTIAEWELNTFGLVMFIIGAGVGIYFAISRLIFPMSGAAPTTIDWTFSNQNDYTIGDASKVELIGNAAKLKLQQYATDSNTKALFHLDENTGTTSADSSGNNNNLTLNSTSWIAGKMSNALSFNGGSSFAEAADTLSLALSQSNTIEAYTASTTAPNTGEVSKQGIVDKGDYQLYVEKPSGKVVYELAPDAPQTWALKGGNDLNGSWDLAGKLVVNTSVEMNGNVYVGLGNLTSDAEVWKWDGTIWTMVGGDGLNSSWAEGFFEEVNILVAYNNVLYAGLGTGTGDAEVWAYTAGTWAKIGGDSINSSWINNTYESVLALTIHSGSLIAGLGINTGEAEVWRLPLSGGPWVKIGDDVPGFGAGYEAVYYLISDGTYLYAGLGNTATDADVWRWNGTTWTKIGGDGVNSSWNTTFEYVYYMTYAGSKLYVGLGNSVTDADVWEWNGTSWLQIGGDGLNTSWNTNYEVVNSLFASSTTLYAGLGVSNGDAEVWSRPLSGGNWTQIGGDALLGSWTNYPYVETLLYYNSKLYAGTTNPSLGAEYWEYNGTTWTLIGGRHKNKSWGYIGLEQVSAMYSTNDYLYAGTGYQAGDALVYRTNGTTWEIIGGQGINGSWALDTFEIVNAIISYKGKVYVTLGSTANDAELWEWNGTSWTKVGGDSVGGSWGINYENAFSLAVYNSKLYVGLGDTAGEGELWQWDSTTWSKIGGDGAGWNATNYERVTSLYGTKSYLYAGLGLSAADAEVWRWNGTTWTQIGGDALNSSWAINTYELVSAMVEYKGQLYASLGNTAGDAEVWRWNGTVWGLIGGDDVSTSWQNLMYEQVYDMAVYNGKLYAGLGNGTGDAEVWEYNGSTWSQIGGDTIASGWTAVIEYVYALSVFNGKLYAGLGYSSNADAQVWAYGNNSILKSTTAISDTNWHHLAGSYDGTQMKIYIDGSLDATKNTAHFVSNKNMPLLVGSTYGGESQRNMEGYMDGKIDEVRISNSARSSFTLLPYPNTGQILQLKNAAYTGGVKSWDSFAIEYSVGVGTIKFRLSDDNGSSWKYWNGTTWVVSADITQSNPADTINSNIGSFPITNNGILWQAVMSGNGEEQVSLTKVTLGATVDDTKPTVNASSIIIESYLNDDWTSTKPLISWQPGEDDNLGIGLLGYCISLDEANQEESSTLDPETNAGKLNMIDDGVALSSCPYIVVGESINLANIAGLNLIASKQYNFSIKAVDKAGNVYSGDPSTYSDLEFFVYDDVAPQNVAYLNVPNTSFGSITDMFFSWPSATGTTSSDSDSGVLGWQYSLNTNNNWKGTATLPSGLKYMPLSGATYIYNFTNADKDEIVIGSNTVYFRTLDIAGNPSPYTSAVIGYGGPAPKFPVEAAVTITPTTSVSNNFAVSWTEAEAQEIPGEENSIKNYYYMINTTPPQTYTTLENNPGIYISVDTNSIPLGPLAGSIKGVNTIYIVAVDQFENYSPSNKISANYTLNSNLPDPPIDLSATDASNKSNELWRASLTWLEPIYKGTGQLTFKIQRSKDLTSWASIGSTTGLSYTDIVASSDTYYYRVGVIDTTTDSKNNPSYSQAVSILPKGHFDEPATLTSGPISSDITTKKAVIRWTTNRMSDSKVSYGLESGKYFPEEQTISEETLDHEITLNNLNAGTTYYYKAKWTDEDGNTGQSVEKTFITNPPPVIMSVDVTNISLSSAIIKFRIKDAKEVDIKYGKTTNFGGIEKLQTSLSESSYSVPIAGLEDGTRYYYSLTLYDMEDELYESNVVLNFTTLARPRATNIKIEEIKGVAQPTVKVTWEANTEITSELAYSPVNDPKDVRTVTLDDNFRLQHEVKIENLIAKTDYVLNVKGRDRFNNSVLADPNKFTTATDTRPPKVSNLSIKSTISTTRARSGNANSAQIFVSWETDEPATGQVEYGEGTGKVYTYKTNLDEKLANKHVIVISDLDASKVYHLKAVSQDSSSNIVNSTDNIIITPKAQDSPIDVVIMSLTNVFGFIRPK